MDRVWLVKATHTHTHMLNMIYDKHGSSMVVAICI